VYGSAPGALRELVAVAGIKEHAGDVWHSNVIKSGMLKIFQIGISCVGYSHKHQEEMHLAMVSVPESDFLNRKM
jgi:hypothetical protein